jgi:hypothetical protein
MPLLEYHAEPRTNLRIGYPYAPDLFRMKGETFAILRVDPDQNFPRPYWLTREQVVALRDMLAQALTEWPIPDEPVVEASLLSPGDGHALAR